MQVFNQLRAFNDLGVVFALGANNPDGDPEVRIGGCPYSMLEEASQYRNRNEVAIRFVLLSHDNTKTLMALDFLKWRVDEDHFGPLPGGRILHYPKKDDTDCLL